MLPQVNRPVCISVLAIEALILASTHYGRSFDGTGVAVADLRIEDPALTQAQAAFRTAGNQLAPVARALPGLDAEAAGAGPLVAKLQEANELLGADFGIVGQALTAVADHVPMIDAAFTQADQQLGRAAGTVR